MVFLQNGNSIGDNGDAVDSVPYLQTSMKIPQIIDDFTKGLHLRHGLMEI